MYTLTHLAHVFDRRDALVGEHTLIEPLEKEGYGLYIWLKANRHMDKEERMRWTLINRDIKPKSAAFWKFLEMELALKAPQAFIFGLRPVEKALPDMDLGLEEELAIKILEGDPVAVDLARDVVRRGA